MDEIKENVKAAIKSIDITKLSLSELSVYIDICNKAKTLIGKDYSEILASMSQGLCDMGVNRNAITIKDLQNATK